MATFKKELLMSVLFKQWYCFFFFFFFFVFFVFSVRKQRPFENLSAGSSKKDFPTPSPSTIKPIRSTRGRTTITTTVPSPKVVTKTTTTTRRTTDLTSSSSPTTTSSSTVSFQNLTTDIHINKVISIASSMPATEFKTERATMEPESLKNVTTAVPGEPVTKPGEFLFLWLPDTLADFRQFFSETDTIEPQCQKTFLRTFCAQRRFRSACAFAQADQNLHLEHFG